MSISNKSYPDRYLLHRNEGYQKSIPPNNPDNLSDLSYLIPSIGVLGIGSIFIRGTRPGIIVGATHFVGFAAVIKVMEHYKSINSDNKKRDEYARHYDKNPLEGTLYNPLVEELLFRGILQPSITNAISSTFPTSIRTCLRTNLSRSTVISIAGTATLFGLLHHINNHTINNRKDVNFQVINATCAGLMYGSAAAKFGLPAAVAAHITFNTSIMTCDRWLAQRDRSASNNA